MNYIYCSHRYQFSSLLPPLVTVIIPRHCYFYRTVCVILSLTATIESRFTLIKQSFRMKNHFRRFTIIYEKPIICLFTFHMNCDKLDIYFYYRTKLSNSNLSATFNYLERHLCYLINEDWQVVAAVCPAPFILPHTKVDELKSQSDGFYCLRAISWELYCVGNHLRYLRYLFELYVTHSDIVSVYLPSMRRSGSSRYWNTVEYQWQETSLTC